MGRLRPALNFFFSIMAISQGFNLPPTGRIGRTTTGHRSGSYNMRVIPDVDVNAERSEKQKAESSKFGFLSDLFNSNYEYTKLGFPKIYQPLNYAIKLNTNFVEINNNQIVIDFHNLIFSKGTLEGILLSNKWLRNIGGNRFIQVEYNNSGIGERCEGAKSVLIIYFHEQNEIIYFQSSSRSYGTASSRRVNTSYLNGYKGRIARIYLFFYQNKKCCNSLYCGYINLNW